MVLQISDKAIGVIRALKPRRFDEFGTDDAATAQFAIGMLVL